MGTGGGGQGAGAGDETWTTPEILGMQDDPKPGPRTLGGGGKKQGGGLRRSKTLGRSEPDSAADVSGAGFGFMLGMSGGVRGVDELMGGGGGGSLVSSREGEEGGVNGGGGGAVGGGGFPSCAWFQTPHPACKRDRLGVNEDESFVEFLREMWRTKGRVMLPYLTHRSTIN